MPRLPRGSVLRLATPLALMAPMLIAACDGPRQPVAPSTGSTAPPPSADGEAPADTIAVALSNLSRIRSYRAQIRTSTVPPPPEPHEAGRDPGAPSIQVAPVTIRSQLECVLPDKLRVELGMPSMEPANSTERRVFSTAIFDGTTQWVAAQMGDAQTKQRISQQKLARKQHPFDTGFAIKGAGLTAGRDLVGTLTGLLQEYDFEHAKSPGSPSDSQCVTMSGRVTAEEQISSMFESPRGTGAELLALQGTPMADMASSAVDLLLSMARQAKVVEIDLCGPARMPRAVRIGPPGGPQDTIAIESFEPDAAIPPDRLRVPDGEQAAYVDITAKLLEHQQRVEVAFQDEPRREALRKELLERLRHGTTSRPTPPTSPAVPSSPPPPTQPGQPSR